MQVARDCQEIAVRVYQKSLVSSLVEMTGSSVSLVEVGRVGDVEVAHQVFQVCARGSDDKMKMVDHEDEGDQTDFVNL